MKIRLSIFAFLFLLSPFFTSCAEKREKAREPASLSQAEREKLSQATFAGGCFWCIEAVFERVAGVKEVVSGYTGGKEKKPTYQQVGSGQTGHAEAVMVYFDASKVSYQELLEIFFAVHDPTTLNRQGPDVGKQYRSIVLYHNAQQEKAVKDYIAFLEQAGKFKNPIVTQVVPFEKFYKAEGYHQNYYALNPDDPYVENVSRPKVEKFEKEFKDKLKKEYQ